jgi:hypothetical protein
MRTIVILGALLAALAAGADASIAAAEAGDSSIRRATNLLRGKRFTRFTETGSVGVLSSYDQRLHLCSAGRFVLDEVSSLPGVTDPRVTRTTGTWRVVSASFSGRRARARVRGVPQGGRPTVIVITTDGRRTTVDGKLVIVERSDLCR